MEREKKSIEAHVQGTKAQLQSHLSSKTLTDLLEHSMDETYKVLHFAMHGNTLQAELDDGKIEPLADMCDTTEDYNSDVEGSAKCIFLNICSSHQLASNLHKEHRVPCVISWKTKVEDEAAMTFAAAFYQHLSKERSRSERFEEAFKMAKRRLKLRGWDLKDPGDQVNENGMKKAAGVPSLFIQRNPTKPRSTMKSKKD